jgi:dimethylamine/trimethylamine dehydrogenase
LAQHEVLFEPIQVGPKKLRNRFYQVPHGPGYGSEKPETRARYAAVQAEGGWAAVSTGICAISPDADISPVRTERLWDDSDIRRLSSLVDQVHEFGALATVELGHGGSDASARGTRWPLLGPSQLASDGHAMRVPKAMDLADIRRVQKDWVKAAERARTAGFDIVYVYGGHTHLPTQFLSGFYNHRSDDYGGSLANRARFWVETLEQVRDAVGEQCAIATRLGITPEGRVGVGLDEVLEFVQLADHLVDLWDVNIGTMATWALDSGASRFVPQGSQLPWASQVQRITDTPVVGVGRLTDPDAMAKIIREGSLSLIGAARPSIADPFLPRKIEQGRVGEIRECIGCNICIATTNTGHMSCTQNPATGEEYRRGWHPEYMPPAKGVESPVLIIGAGPAGLECAQVLGRRGFEAVHLVEAEAQPGGALRWMCRMPGLGEWARVWEWRENAIRLLPSVSVLLGRRLTARDVLEYGAEIVVVATGSHWATDGLNHLTHEPVDGYDATLPYVMTPEQVMVEGKRPPGRTGQRVTVYDSEGYFVATALAELMAGEGHVVDFVTPFAQVAPFADETLEGTFVRNRLHELGVRVHLEHVLSSVAPSMVTLSNNGTVRTLDSAAVVAVTQRVSNDSLYTELASDPTLLAGSGVRSLYRVGDCVSPRLIADAVFDGSRLAREIDGPHPAQPLPFRREEPLPPLRVGHER